MHSLPVNVTTCVCRLHKHVKGRLLRHNSSNTASSGLRVAALQSQFVFRVAASIGDDDTDGSVSGALQAQESSTMARRRGIQVASTTAGHSAGSCTKTATNKRCKSGSSGSGGSKASSGTSILAKPAAQIQRPKGAVLEVPKELDPQEFMQAVQAAADVKRVYPDRVISISQGNMSSSAAVTDFAGQTRPAPLLGNK